MNQSSHVAPRVRPADRLLGLYAAVAGVALFFPGRPDAWPVLALLHAAAAWVAIRPASVEPLLARVAALPGVRFLGSWYPLLLIPALYKELGPLNVSVHGGRYFDSHILDIEHAIFGAPSQSLARSFPYLGLSELLHFCYLSYYLIIYVPPAVLYFRKRKVDFDRMLFTVLLTFFVHYVFFIYYPVQGPRYLFPAPGGEIAEGPLYALTHKALEAGSARGAAFPSSHVGVSVAQTLVTLAALPALGRISAVLTVGLATGAVYGGFHYATDAMAGLLLGIIAFALAPRLRRALSRGEEQ